MCIPVVYQATGVKSSVRNPLRISFATSSADREIAHQMLDAEHFPGVGLEVGTCHPLVAERFSNLESHCGTVYKATNGTLAGDTAGFSQSQTDYDMSNDRPKKLWLKPFYLRAFRLMCAKGLPDDCQQAVVVSDGARNPAQAQGTLQLAQFFPASMRSPLCPKPQTPALRSIHAHSAHGRA